MIIGLDAGNIRAGGGLTHIIELLRVVHEDVRYEELYLVILVHPEIKDRVKRLVRPADKVMLGTVRNRLTSRIWSNEKIDVLIVLGGLFIGNFRPTIIVHRNLLPFRWKEVRRFGFRLVTVRLVLLRILQCVSIRNSSVTVYLSESAEREVSRLCQSRKTTVIGHGVSELFRTGHMWRERAKQSKSGLPVRLIYTGTLAPYKNHLELIHNLACLRREPGFDIQLTLVGGGYSFYKRRVEKYLKEIDDQGHWVYSKGILSREALIAEYENHDCAIFASGCETFGQSMREAQLTGIPIVAIDTDITREILGQSALYYDLKSISSLKTAIQRAIDSPLSQSEWPELKIHKTWTEAVRQLFQVATEVAIEKHEKKK